MYKNAIQPEKSNLPEISKRLNQTKSKTGQSSWGPHSSSEDEQLHSSDEMQEQVNLFLNTLHFANFSDTGRDTGIQRVRESSQPQPSTSRQANEDNRRLTPPAPPIQQRVEGLIRDAENAKARMNEVPGMLTNNSLTGIREGIDTQSHFVHSAMVDEDYLVVAAHIDENLAKRIRSGEYIDFACLLPRDRVQQENDSRIQLIAMQDGRLRCAPNTDVGEVSPPSRNGNKHLGCF